MSKNDPDYCDGCGANFDIFRRKEDDHVVRFPDGLGTAKDKRERYCSPECFIENYDQ